MKKLLREVVLMMAVPLFFVIEGQVLSTYCASLIVSAILIWFMNPSVALIYTALLLGCYLNALIFGRLKCKAQTKKQAKAYSAYHNVLLMIFVVTMLFTDWLLGIMFVVFNASFQAVIWIKDYAEWEGMKAIPAICTIVMVLSPILCMILFFYTLWGMNIAVWVKILITLAYYGNMVFLSIWQAKYESSFTEIVLSEYAFRDYADKV